MSTATEVARAFGLGTPTRELTPVARGAMGEVFRLDTDGGSFAVKRLLWGPAGNEEANAAFQFAAADADVPLARPLLTTNGDVLTRLDDWWRAYEWIEADEACRADPVQIATALGRLHALKYDAGPGPDDWYTAALPEERIANAVDVAVQHGFDMGDRLASMLLFNRVVACAEFGPIVGCHNDVDNSNVIVARGQVVLIDWDNAGPGVASHEFASALANWAHDDAEIIASMVRQYRMAGGVFAPNDLSVFATGWSAFLHYFANCSEHLDADGATAEDLAFERPFLQYVSANPFGIRRYEQILEMVPA